MSELGHSHPSLPAPTQPDVGYAPNCDQRIAAPQFDAMGQSQTCRRTPGLLVVGSVPC